MILTFYSWSAVRFSLTSTDIFLPNSGSRISMTSRQWH